MCSSSHPNHCYQSILFMQLKQFRPAKNWHNCLNISFITRHFHWHFTYSIYHPGISIGLQLMHVSINLWHELWYGLWPFGNMIWAVKASKFKEMAQQTQIFLWEVAIVTLIIVVGTISTLSFSQPTKHFSPWSPLDDIPIWGDDCIDPKRSSLGHCTRSISPGKTDELIR